MKPSSIDDVRDMYDKTADSYSEMMDTEIELPVYADMLGRLRERMADMPGTLIDTACGSGHMLSLYQKRYDRKRPLLGIDLSPRMVALADRKIGPGAKVVIGDMRDLSSAEAGSAAAVLNFFALHHLVDEDVRAALGEWHRVLRPGGQLLIATWEGDGVVDYGDESDIVALRYSSQQIDAWTREAGFVVTRCVVDPVEEMPMDVVYLEGIKE